MFTTSRRLRGREIKVDDDDETGKQQKNPADGGGRHVMVSAAVWMDWEEEEERVDGVLTP